MVAAVLEALKNLPLYEKNFQKYISEITPKKIINFLHFQNIFHNVFNYKTFQIFLIFFLSSNFIHLLRLDKWNI